MSSQHEPSPRPARIAVDLTTFTGGGEPGGLKLFVFGFLQWIAQARGNEFSFIYFTRQSLVPEVEAFRRETDLNVCVRPEEGGPAQPNPKPGLVWAPWGVQSWRDRWPADLLYTPWGFSELSRPDVPSVNLVADTLHRDLPGFLPPDEVARRDEWFGRMLGKAAAVQCNSEFVSGQMRRHFEVPAEKLFVTHNAIQDQIVSAARERLAAPPSTPYFFYPANDWPHKNHERLLKAYAVYRRGAGGNAWDLVLTGHFTRDGELRDKISQLGIADGCRMLGYLGRAEFAPAFRDAGALVFPSLYEGFGIPVLEAMALGVPIACAGVASVPEVAGDAALFFDPYKVADIAGALARISCDAELRRKLAARGLERVATFSIEREAGRLADRFLSIARP